MSESVVCFIGLGSNLNDPSRQIKSALHALQHHPQISEIQSSSLYVSSPMGPQDQPDYVNAVARLETVLTPEALLDVLQTIENDQGRVRKSERWGPRTLDLDLLMYGDQQIVSERLQVPHPGIVERSFVLLPWCEIAADMEIPGLGVISNLAQSFSENELVKLEESPL